MQRTTYIVRTVGGPALPTFFPVLKGDKIDALERAMNQFDRRRGQVELAQVVHGADGVDWITLCRKGFTDLPLDELDELDELNVRSESMFGLLETIPKLGA